MPRSFVPDASGLLLARKPPPLTILDTSDSLAVGLVGGGLWNEQTKYMNDILGVGNGATLAGSFSWTGGPFGPGGLISSSTSVVTYARKLQFGAAPLYVTCAFWLQHNLTSSRPVTFGAGAGGILATNTSGGLTRFSGSGNLFTPDNLAPASAWCHVVVQIDLTANLWSLWVNGVAAGNNPAYTGGAFAGAQQVTHLLNGGQAGLGMDMPLIWNRQLTAPERARLRSGDFSFVLPTPLRRLYSPGSFTVATPTTTGYTLLGPSTATDGSPSTPITVALSPANSIENPSTTVTFSDGGAGGTFSPATVVLGGVPLHAGWPSPNQSASVTYTPITTGAITISVTNSAGLTNPGTLTITSSAIAIAAPSVVLNTIADTVANLTANLSGGKPPYTVQWYRSTTSGFTPGAGNILAGATSTTLTDTGLTPNTPYYYICVETDSTTPTPQVATSTQQVATTQSSPANMVLGAIGDSITASNGIGGPAGAPTTVQAAATMLMRDYGWRNITVSNAGQPGSQTANWFVGGAYYIAAKAAFSAAGVTHIQIMLGTNDANSGVSAATFQANMATIVAQVQADFPGVTIILHAPPYRTLGLATTTGATLALVQSYQGAIAALCNGTTVLQGVSSELFNYFSANQQEIGDGLHPTYPTGVQSYGSIWSRALARALIAADKPGPTGSAFRRTALNGGF